MTQPSDSAADLEWLFARQRFGVKPGLERVENLLTLLGQPQERFEVVLVGGTNGKGSTAATLASILKASGQRVGLFTSPHLTHFSERFVVNGQQLSMEVVSAALARVRPLAEDIGASFFEVVTALGCRLFAEAGVQTAVMEVGLGGRWDATNALSPRLSIITNVALDHTAILGPTTEAIAAEKAGILRAGRLAVTGVSADLLPVLERQQTDLLALGRDFTVQVEAQGWQGAAVEVLLQPETRLHFSTPLLGLHGAQNAALASVAAWRLGVDEQTIQAGTATTHWPGRLEVLPHGPGKIILDGAHNPAGAEALAEALRGLGITSVPLIFGAAEDKDIAAVAKALAPLASQVFLTRAVLSPRAAEPADLAAFFPEIPVTLTSSPAEALALTSQFPLVVAAGSLYLLGELRPLLVGSQVENRERWQ